MKQLFSWDAHGTRWQLQLFLEIHRGMLNCYRDPLHYEVMFSLRPYFMLSSVILRGRRRISRANLFGIFHHTMLSSKNSFPL